MNAMAGEYVTRAVVFNLDLSRSQERLAYSYAGARRFSYNWAIGVVRENLETRSTERATDVAEDDLTPALSWSAYSLGKAFNALKEEVAPWWREVSMHALRSGVADAATALANFSESKKGTRSGRRVGFPNFKSRNRSIPSVSFIEINHQLSWLHPDRHHIRLMLPQTPSDPDVKRRAANLAWIHTTESTRRLYNLVEQGRARIQKVTISQRGGRWQVAFSVRYLLGLPARRAVGRSVRQSGMVGLDAGLTHLATLDRVVGGLTDEVGHIANPRVLENQLKRLAKLDRAWSRTQKGSKNRAKLRRRRARLHGSIAKTRALQLHRLTNALVDRFDAVAIEDLAVVAMSNRKHRLGRSMADASLGELRRQFAYKSSDRSTTLIVVDRFYPSSKTCSCCGVVRAKLPLSTRVFECESCGASLDRDVNAARNIAREGARLLSERSNGEQSVAGLRPETQNADPRSRQTNGAPAPMAAVA
jgi:putative transposase